jgi:hypothetical protein
MDNVVNFPSKKDEAPPTEREVMFDLIVYGNGDVSIHTRDYIQTTEQYNWLFSAIASGTAMVVEEKRAAMKGGTE